MPLIFVIGSIWFWLLTVVASIIIILCIDSYPSWDTYNRGNSPGKAFLTLAFAFGALIFFGDLKVAELFKNPALLAEYLGGYILAGVLISFVKWTSYIRTFVDYVKERKRAFLIYHKLGEDGDIPANFVDEWYNENRFTAPEASGKKGLITSWMMYWPWVLVWTVINDPVRRICKWVFERVHGVYDKITNHMTKDITDDLIR